MNHVLKKNHLFFLFLLGFMFINCKESEKIISDFQITVSDFENNVVFSKKDFLMGTIKSSHKIKSIFFIIQNLKNSESSVIKFDKKSKSEKWSIELPQFEDGRYELSYYVKGKGFRSAVKPILEFEVDNTPPEIFIIQNEKSNIKKNNLEINFRVSDRSEVEFLEVRVKNLESNYEIPFSLSLEEVQKEKPIVIARYTNLYDLSEIYNPVIKKELFSLRRKFIQIYGNDADLEKSPDRNFSISFFASDSLGNSIHFYPEEYSSIVLNPNGELISNSDGSDNSNVKNKEDVIL